MCIHPFCPRAPLPLSEQCPSPPPPSPTPPKQSIAAIHLAQAPYHRDQYGDGSNAATHHPYGN